MVESSAECSPEDMAIPSLMKEPLLKVLCEMRSSLRLDRVERHPAFALCQLGEAPADPRNPGFRKRRVLKMDKWMNDSFICLDDTAGGMSCPAVYSCCAGKPEEVLGRVSQSSAPFMWRAT